MTKFTENRWQSFAPERAFGRLIQNRFKTINIGDERETAGSRPTAEQMRAHSKF
jgi:hypothetical protein